MEDRVDPGRLNVRRTDLSQGAASCAPWWSAFVHARADVAHIPEPLPSCRDYTAVKRSCDVVRDTRTGRDILHCHETREKFRLCSDRVEKLSTTSIETREPILDGHTLVATRSWEPVSPHDDVDVADASGPGAAVSRQPLSLEADQDQPSVSGRSYRLWHARADDGTRGLPGGSSSGSGDGPVLTPRVGKAVEEIMLFADEMQRDLAQHGLVLVRRGEEEHRRRPGFIARLFGARWTDEAARGEASTGSHAGPHSA